MLNMVKGGWNRLMFGLENFCCIQKEMYFLLQILPHYCQLPVHLNYPPNLILAKQFYDLLSNEDTSLIVELKLSFFYCIILFYFVFSAVTGMVSFWELVKYCTLCDIFVFFTRCHLQQVTGHVLFKTRCDWFLAAIFNLAVYSWCFFAYSCSRHNGVQVIFSLSQ